MINKKEKDIGKFTEIKDKHVNEITNLYDRINQMMPIAEV